MHMTRLEEGGVGSPATNGRVRPDERDSAIACLQELVEEGKIKYLGVSEFSPENIRRAHAVHPISAAQIEWSLWTRDVEVDIVPTLRELGIGIVAYSPLGRGFLTGAIKRAEDIVSGDSRTHHPRFQKEAFDEVRTLRRV